MNAILLKDGLSLRDIIARAMVLVAGRSEVPFPPRSVDLALRLCRDLEGADSAEASDRLRRIILAIDRKYRQPQLLRRSELAFQDRLFLMDEAFWKYAPKSREFETALEAVAREAGKLFTVEGFPCEIEFVREFVNRARARRGLPAA